MTHLYSPLQSLQEGHWFKLICGASFQHLPAVRNLTLAFTLAGVDCIDVAADPAVIATAQTAIDAAIALLPQLGDRLPAWRTRSAQRPWLMVSLNDGEDPHFRKAEFDPFTCPADCPRPCERICPAQAIVFDCVSHPASIPPPNTAATQPFSGVIDQRCYGCGRCIPICPISHISTRSYVFTPEAVAPLVLQGVDAVEIHTQVGRLEDFQRLWAAIAPWVYGTAPHSQLKLVAISCPDGEGLLDYLHSLYQLMAPLPCTLVWQTDGRPMSGDIGEGATRAAIQLGQKVLNAQLPGYVQLAGGTNHSTVAKLQALGLLRTSSSAVSGRAIAGVAYGSYARRLLTPVLEQLETTANHQPDVSSLAIAHLEAVPELLEQALDLASELVSQLKAPTLSLHYG